MNKPANWLNNDIEEYISEKGGFCVPGWSIAFTGYMCPFNNVHMYGQWVAVRKDSRGDFGDDMVYVMAGHPNSRTCVGVGAQRGFFLDYSLAVPLLEPDIPLISREDFYKYVYKCFGVLVASVKELECRKSEKN